MANIMLACAQGMSTSFLVERMQRAAQTMKLEGKIWAVGSGQIQDESRNADIILLGPQIRFRKAEIEKQIGHRCPVEIIDMLDYGFMNGEAVLKKALKMLES